MSNLSITIEVREDVIKSLMSKALTEKTGYGEGVLQVAFNAAMQENRIAIQKKITATIDSILKDDKFTTDLTDKLRTELFMGAVNKAARIAAGGGK